MNITEAKALFFAQYYGQQIIEHADDYFVLSILPVAGRFIDRINDNMILLLRTVEQLTDEEAHTVCLLAYTPLYDHKMDKDTIRLGKGVLNLPHLSEKTATYLKLIGVLVRFTYLNKENKPITLSPDEIIKFGWVKIKE